MNKNFRTKYYEQKRKELDQLFKIPVKTINIDTFRSELYYKWGHSLKLNIVKLNNKLHLKVQKELGYVSDYDKLNIQFEELNIGDYLIYKIKEYPQKDIIDAVYIILE